MLTLEILSALYEMQVIKTSFKANGINQAVLSKILGFTEAMESKGRFHIELKTWTLNQT